MGVANVAIYLPNHHSKTVINSTSFITPKDEEELKKIHRHTHNNRKQPANSSRKQHTARRSVKVFLF
jgi:hypothetical protein